MSYILALLIVFKNYSFQCLFDLSAHNFNLFKCSFTYLFIVLAGPKVGLYFFCVLILLYILYDFVRLYM